MKKLVLSHSFLKDESVSSIVEGFKASNGSWYWRSPRPRTFISPQVRTLYPSFVLEARRPARSYGRWWPAAQAALHAHQARSYGRYLMLGSLAAAEIVPRGGQNRYWACTLPRRHPFPGDPIVIL